SFGRVLNRRGAERESRHNARTRAEAMMPNVEHLGQLHPVATAPGSDLATILTGEMFAPILGGLIEKYNVLRGTKLRVLGVPNTYFGGDVAVAGLLPGRDLLNVKDRITGDFVIIPKHVIKSDEPILLDGMMYGQLKEKLSMPIYAFDTSELMRFLSS